MENCERLCTCKIETFNIEMCKRSMHWEHMTKYQYDEMF